MNTDVVVRWCCE